MFPFKRPSTPPRLDIADVTEKVGAGEMILVDVRETAEVRGSGLAVGAINIPLALLAMKADPRHPNHDARLNPETPIALYCASGGRSGVGAQMLQKLGYTAVYNIGGLGDWISGGGAITR